MKTDKRKTSGWTMVEMMVTSGITAIFILMAVSAFVAVSRTATTVRITNSAQKELRNVFDIMVKELRSTTNLNGFDKDNWIGFQTTSATETQWVDYSLSAMWDEEAPLWKWVSTDTGAGGWTWTGGVVATGITGLDVVPYNRDGTTITTNWNFWQETYSIVIKMESTAKVRNRNYTNTVQTRVKFRNK